MKTAFIITSLLSLALAGPLRPRQSNLQTFTGALGGIAPTPVENSGDSTRPFSVKGDTFVNIGAALQRSCDQQFNACANSANGGNAALSVSACSDQQTQCNAAGQGVTATGTASAGNAATTTAAAAATSSAAATGSTGASCTKKVKKATIPAL